jgi:hypothetical protein
MDGGIGGSPGPIGSGQNTAPPAKLARCDNQAIVSVRPWGFLRVFGLAFFAVGLLLASNAGMFVISQINKDLYKDALSGGLVMLVMPLIFGGIGYVAMAPMTLRIEIGTRTYQECWGWWPLCQKQEGNCDQFARLSLRTYPTLGEPSVTLLLHWRDPERQPYPLFTSNPTIAHAQTLIVASILGCPSWTLTRTRPAVDEKQRRKGSPSANHPSQISSLPMTVINDPLWRS